MSELILILVIALIILGPQRLPELARSLGKGLNEFRRAANDIKSSLDIEEELEQPSVPEEIGSIDSNPYPYQEETVNKTRPKKETGKKTGSKAQRKSGRKTDKTMPAG